MFGKVIDEANMKDLEEMKAHDVGLKMMQTKAATKKPLTEIFIRQLHQNHFVRRLHGLKQIKNLQHLAHGR